MAVPPLYKYTRRFFELPEILAQGYYHSTGHDRRPPIPVIFLFQTPNESREEICKAIEAGDGETWPEDLTRPALASVPWLRNYTPDTNAVFRLIKDIDYEHISGSPLILVDKEGVENGTCLIWHCLYGHGEKKSKEEQHELARVETSKAYRLICEARPQKSWFPDILNPECEVSQPAVEPEEEWEVIEREADRTYTWPDHLAPGFKLEENKPTIIALNHLEEAQLDEIIAGIGKDERYGEITILNWTSSTNSIASEADMWYIADRIKPTWEQVVPYGETYCFFVYSVNATPTKKPKILKAVRRKVADETRPVQTNSYNTANSMSMSTVQPDLFWKFWHAAWNPSGGGYSSDVRYNVGMDTLIRSSNSWEDILVTNPEVPVISAFNDIPVFVLQPMSPSQEFQIRSLLQASGETIQFLYVPGGDGTIKKLVQYLQSPSWMSYHKRPPGDFVAIDKSTLSSLDSDNPEFILGTAMMIWHHSSNDEHSVQLALDNVGYAVGRVEMNDEDDYQMWTGSVLNAMGLGRFIGVPYGDLRDADEGVERHYWDSWVDAEGNIAKDVERYVSVMD